MSQQRNMFQMKEQDKTSEEQLNEVEMGNLLEKKFKLMIKKMIKELGRIVDKQNEKLELFFFFFLQVITFKQRVRKYCFG